MRHQPGSKAYLSTPPQYDCEVCGKRFIEGKEEGCPGEPCLECARLRAELAQARAEIERLKGLAANQTAELLREINRAEEAERERDQARAELKELGGHAHDNLVASTAHARAAAIEDAATWVERRMTWQPDVAREVAEGIRGLK